MIITPYPKNAKEHPDKQLKLLAKIVAEVGWRQNVEINQEGVIVAGHGRYLTWEKYKDEYKLPDVWVTDDTGKTIMGKHADFPLNEEQEKMWRLADNQINAMTGVDMDLVTEELKELSEEMLELTGFDSDLIIEPDEKDDEVPETPEEPQSQLGDLYELGSHRVLCGDSTKIDDVLRLMGGLTADISFTSPPYNVGHNLGYEGKDSKYIHTDNSVDYQDLIVSTTNNSLLNAKDVFVNLQFLAGNKKQLLLWLADLADNFKDIFFWKKKTSQPAMAENVANSQVEVIVLFGKENNSRSWGNKRFRGTFSNSIETQSAGAENKNAKIHNATFPVELPLTFLKEGYENGSLVLDLFGGTGTTMIACEKLGMKCNLLELEPLYIDVIVQRYVDYTGNDKIKKNGIDIIWKKK